MNKISVTIFFLIIAVMGCMSQVGIYTASPNNLTVLDVQNELDSYGVKVPKGIMVPRLTEAQRDAIDVSNDSIANSLLIYNIDENCFNFYSKSDLEWKSVCGAMGKAQFTFDCASLEVRGRYRDNVALDNSNYLRVTLNVTKPGSYSISATATPDNGYFFETTGNFYSPGPVTLNIPGTGQPVLHSQGADLLDVSDDNPDNFDLISSGGSVDCPFDITVLSTAARPNFTIDCAATVVEGTYFEDQALSATPSTVNGQSHRIKVTLKNIPVSSYGAVAVLETNTVDGISFRGEAMLSSSVQDIYLSGTGVPRGLNNKIMTVTGNSESDQTSCTATVHMLIPRKRLLGVGVSSEYGYNPGDVTTHVTNSMNTMLTDKDNFGYNQWSMLKFAGFNNRAGENWVGSPNSWTDDNRDIIAMNTAAWQGMTGPTLTALLNGTNGQPKIDVVMIGYSTEYCRSGNANDIAKANALINFIKTGGILMICAEETVSNGNFLNMLFNGSQSGSIGSATGASAGSLYALGFSDASADLKPYYCKDDDPILRGPFEDIVGRTWGEDASTTRYVTNLPLDEIVIYSGARPIGTTAQPADGVTVFRHKEYPFIFIGDGGFNSNHESRTGSSLTICPFRLGTKTVNGHTYNNYPVNKAPYGNATGRSYNAVFTANAFAWCIMKAEEYRKGN
jgi:hypothetical protein